jgi:3-oxoacyl-[acyl-carrier protein] reductase
VNAVAPGPIATELFLNGKTENQIAEFTKMSPLERIGQPGDIANVLSFLAGAGQWLDQLPSAMRERRLCLLRPAKSNDCN